MPVPNFHSLPSLNTRSEYKVPSKASYTGFGTRLVVERVRHHSCGPSISPQHSITEWACWNEMGRSGLSMMKAIARVVPTGVCKCRFRHSGATLRTHATKSVSPVVSAGLGTLGDEGPSGPPSWVERLTLDHGAKTLPELTAPVWDKAPTMQQSTKSINNPHRGLNNI